MSADSPNHSRHELTATTVQNTVTPQPVTDPTILDSVAGFINEVVPTAGGDTFDSKDQIQWARFESLDFDESSFSPTSDSVLPSSLILVLGYTTGVQVWAVPANGEAVELFSWRHGSVKVLRILPAPFEVGSLNKRDFFESKRPLIALVDVALHGSSANYLNFYSLKTGEQVKQIKFKSQILDVLANRRSIVITFSEKLAVFDAFTLEDKLSVTSCYLSPGIQPNPVALGPRWLAFAEKKLIASRRSSGGNEGEGVQSYTATVLHAAKSLGRGLRELGDVVASSLTGNQTGKLGTSPNSPQAGGSADVPQKGIVTVLDIENPTSQNADGSLHPETIVAHFVAHTEAIVWLQFGPCGMLLLTADKRGHDFNLFRINPHPVGSALAAVHHLYTLHRGDTSARVQDMCFTFDSRWVAVSTLRGTTHVFPITPYGGNIGVRTHTTPHVVNKMSRFHRSAGLTSEGRSNSPVSMFESPISSNFPFHNPRFAPFPHPTVVNPLAQLRQPVYMQNIGTATPRQGRQRLTSSSEDNIALRVATCFAPARAWIDSTTPLPRETPLNKSVKPVESLFVMNCHGTLVQYDLEPHHVGGVPKEKVCDDTPIELTVTAKAQWRLQRQPATTDRPLPLSHQSLMFVMSTIPAVKKKVDSGNEDDWLSQVEIITHAGPHRRLWMGPQFTFKTYSAANGTSMSVADAQPLDLNRSKPVNMPITKANTVLIESSSASSSEQSLLDIYRKNCEEMGAAGEHQIKEDLADAMMESPGVRESGGRCVLVSVKSLPVHPQRASAAPAPIAKIVNPLGTVVTVHSDDETEAVVPPEDIVIYENCDETMFRPLVTPKTLAYCRSSKADAGNIMTQSLKGDTNVTVRLLEKTEGPTRWEEPQVHDIKNDTKVIVKEGEVKDLLVQKTVEEACSTVEEDEQISQLPKVTSTSSSEKEFSKKPIAKTKKEKKSSKMQDDFDRAELEESSYGLVNPLYNVLEECERIKSQKSREPIEKAVTTPKSDENSVQKNSRKAKNRKTFKDNGEVVEDKAKELDSSKTSSKTKKKPKDELGLASKDDTDMKPQNPVLKELQSVEEISFPALDSKLVIPEFPPLEDNFFSLENLAKTDGYEDAEDCGLPLQPADAFSDEEPQQKCPDTTEEEPRNELISSDTVSTSEDNVVDETPKKTASVKKPRKPKPKLGVKINKDDSPDKDSTPERSLVTSDVSAEITLPAPKRSWSSVAASKTSEPPKSDPWSTNNNNNNNPPEENYTITIPYKKSYSTLTTEKLLDIDTPEERTTAITPGSEDLMDVDKAELARSSTLLSVESPDLLKLSDKSSDDEKNESGSSPIETTESSDEGKLLGALAGDFDAKSRSTANVGGSKSNGKKRIRKKKK